MVGGCGCVCGKQCTNCGRAKDRRLNYNREAGWCLPVLGEGGQAGRLSYHNEKRGRELWARFEGFCAGQPRRSPHPQGRGN